MYEIGWGGFVFTKLIAKLTSFQYVLIVLVLLVVLHNVTIIKSTNRNDSN